MRGRKPKPTEQRRVEGNAGKRPLNTREPQMPAAADGFDSPPQELAGDAGAASEWARLAPILRRARAVTDADRGALLSLCQQWSLYLKANASVASAGMVVKAPSGYPMTNPYIPIANKALGMCLKLWQELGLTPSSRSRVTVVPGGMQSADQFSEFDAVDVAPVRYQ